MSKKLNEANIVNELRGGSAFFPSRPQSSTAAPDAISQRPPDAPSLPTASPTVAPQGNETTEAHGVTTVQPMIRSSERTNIRRRVRHSFDIYHDQLLSLREIALSRETVFGERVLLGDLVQEALDMFITKERNNE